LKKVLKYLPEPTYAEVSLFGNFDYSDLFRQAQEVVKGIFLQTGRGLVFRLEDVSKEKIFNLYRKSQNPRKSGIPKRIDLYKVDWYLDNQVQVELRPGEVNVKYRGLEPNYISQMRQELAGTNVRLRIEVNK